MAWFIVYMKTIHSKWPLELYVTESPKERMVESLTEIKQCLVENGKIFYQKKARKLLLQAREGQSPAVSGR